jgi:hypothetical protein
MRVIGEPCDIIIWIVTFKVVEHQVRIEALLQLLRQYASQFNASAVLGIDPSKKLLDLTRLGHNIFFTIRYSIIHYSFLIL